MSESKGKGIYVVNAEHALHDKFWQFVIASEDDCNRSLNSEIKRAFRKHVFSGKAMEYCKLIYWVDPRELKSEHLAEAAIAEKNGMQPVYFNVKFYSDIETCSVRDWATEMYVHSPKIHAAVLKKKVSFQAMIDHATRWHEAKARAAEKIKERGLPVDEKNSPTVLELDGEFAGWRWVWLKTNEARDAEGTVMGHCVGDGYYDSLPDGCGVFSLRDRQNRPHVTMKLNGCRLWQAKCKGNASPGAQYTDVIWRGSGIIGLRLALKYDPAVVLQDGEHKNAQGRVFVSGGLAHRENGPAVVTECKVQYVEHGSLIREIEIVEKGYTEEWFLGGVHHRSSGGPAVTRDTGHDRVETEWWIAGVEVNEDGSDIGPMRNRFDKWGVAYGEPLGEADRRRAFVWGRTETLFRRDGETDWRRIA